MLLYPRLPGASWVTVSVGAPASRGGCVWATLPPWEELRFGLPAECPTRGLSFAPDLGQVDVWALPPASVASHLESRDNRATACPLHGEPAGTLRSGTPRPRLPGTHSPGLGPWRACDRLSGAHRASSRSRAGHHTRVRFTSPGRRFRKSLFPGAVNHVGARGPPDAWAGSPELALGLSEDAGTSSGLHWGGVEGRVVTARRTRPRRGDSGRPSFGRAASFVVPVPSAEARLSRGGRGESEPSSWKRPPRRCRFGLFREERGGLRARGTQTRGGGGDPGPEPRWLSGAHRCRRGAKQRRAGPGSWAGPVALPPALLGLAARGGVPAVYLPGSGSHPARGGDRGAEGTGAAGRGGPRLPEL